jgi:hypothetical protein
LTPAAPVDVVAAPQQQVVAEPASPVQAAGTPVVTGAQQALFLTEEAIVMSANGSLSSIVILASILGLITLIAAVALHLNNGQGKDGFQKNSYSNNYFNFFKKSEGNQEKEEYLLIK